MGLLDFNRRLIAPFQRSFPLQNDEGFTAAVNKAKKPVPQGNPEQEQDGSIDHTIKRGEMLGTIAPLYDQGVPDLLATNPNITDPDIINEGASLRVLDKERRTSLETINSIQGDIDKASSPAEKDEKTKALKLAVSTDLMSAVKNGAFTPASLKDNLDQREADLIALGPQTEAYKTTVRDERKTVETSLNDVFKPLSGAITAAQQDPSKWGQVQAELTTQFETLAKGTPDNGEAAINAARETLKTYGPSDAKFVEMLDAAGHEILVARPARAVQDAFKKGESNFHGLEGDDKRQVQIEDGASKAAKTLNEVTKNVTPDTAQLILLEANKPIDAFGNKDTKIVDVIETTIGRRTAIANGAIPDDKLSGKNSMISGEIKLSTEITNKNLVADYSAITGHISQGTGGDKFVSDRAENIVKSFKVAHDQTFSDWEKKLPEETKDFTFEEKKAIGSEMGIPYPEIKAANPDAAGDPFRQAIANGNDPTLTLAVVKKLDSSGDKGNANKIFDAAIKGTDDFTKNSQHVVGEFAKDHLVVASDWKSSLSAEQITAGLNDSIKNNPGSKETMDAQGAKIVRNLAALHEAEEGLKGMEGFDRYTKSVSALENDEKGQFAVANSAEAWDEMGKLYVESTVKPEEVTVPAAPTLYWSGRAVIGLHRTLSAYEALGGNKAYVPPTPGSIDAASRMSPGQVDSKLAQSANLALNGPNAATDPKARKAALESLAKSFDGSKFDPRAGITTASGFGKGLAAVQGLLYLGSADANFSAGGPLPTAFGVWLTAGIAYEAGQLGAGGVRSLVEHGKIPKDGFLDRASRFAEVSGTPKWGWFTKYFDRAGGALMVAYTLDHAANGRWANSAFAATTTLGTFLSMMKTPKAGPWGVALAAIGIIGEMGYDAYRHSKAAAYYEGPTEKFLIAAGFDSEAAKILSDHDGDGNSVGGVIDPLAKELGMTPQALVEVLRKSDHDKLKEFVAGVHQAKPDDKGKYPMTAPPRPKDIEVPPSIDMPEGGTIVADPAMGRPRTIPELADWARENLVLTS